MRKLNITRDSGRINRSACLVHSAPEKSRNARKGCLINCGDVNKLKNQKTWLQRAAFFFFFFSGEVTWSQVLPYVRKTGFTVCSYHGFLRSVLLTLYERTATESVRWCPLSLSDLQSIAAFCIRHQWARSRLVQKTGRVNVSVILLCPSACFGCVSPSPLQNL